MSAERHTPEVRRLKRRIRTLSAELAFRRSEELGVLLDRAKNWAHAQRVIDWVWDINRKPANTAFTAGPERQLAYMFEMVGLKKKEQTCECAKNLLK